MRMFGKYHFVIALTLCAVAILMYATGAHFAATGAIILGCVVEVIAWFVLAADPSRGRFAENKR